MKFLEEMKAAEVRALGYSQAVEMGDLDWAPIKTRFADIRQRYCTARALAREVAVGLGSAFA